MDYQNQPQLRSSQSFQQKLTNLHELAYKLQAHPQNPEPLLRQYVSTYIQSHHKSQQYFIALCQNKFLTLMLQNSQRISQPTCILQCLNLLLTNTKLQQQLVYIFSQNAVHDYLFNATILKKDNQFVQYYIQLLKTMLLKISEHQNNKFLIRMFCNNKYPNFPLFTYVTILGSDSNQLIRVTAQQCILILVGLINQKKIYQVFLSEPAMFIFVVRLATEFLKNQADHEGICKYFADLMYELRGNKIPLLFISNILCNVIIVPSIVKKITFALNFVQILTKSLETRILQHKGLPTQQKNDSYYSKKNIKSNKNQKKLYNLHLQISQTDNLIIICSVFYRIIAKFLTNKYINATYLASYIQFCATSQLQQGQISLPLKVSYPGAQAQWKIIQQFTFKKYFEDVENLSQSQACFDFIEQIQSKLNQYSSSKQFSKLRENYLKKSNQPSKTQSFFGRIFNRGTPDQLTTQYIKYVSDFSSLSFTKGQPINKTIYKQFNPSTSSFFSQYIIFNASIQKGLKYDKIKTGQQTQSVQPNQINFNAIRSMWSFNPSMIDIIVSMSKKFCQFINTQSTQRHMLVVPKLYIPPCYLFLVQFKDYLSVSINDHINHDLKNIQIMQTTPILINLTKICTLLNVQLTQKSYITLISQINQLHQQIQTCLFQNGFKDVVDYVKLKNKLVVMGLQDKYMNKSMNKQKYNNKINDNLQPKQKPPRKKSGNILKIKIKPGITFIKLCSFQCIQKIMDPQIKPLNKYFQTKWIQGFNKIPQQYPQFHQQILYNFKVCYFGKNGCIMNFVKLGTPPTVVLRIELLGKKLLQIDINQLDGIKINSVDNRVLQFGSGNIENIKVQSVQMGVEIVEKYKQSKFLFQQCITNAMLEYLSNTKQAFDIKCKNMMRSSIRINNYYQTPQ